MEKIIKQSTVCVILFLVIMIMKNLDTPVTNFCVAQLSGDYTQNVTTAVFSDSTDTYGEPIDEYISGDTASVYSVRGGTVIDVGENEAMGKYVKIDHGGQAESVYGQCDTVCVKALERVKKGQIIGTYRKDNEKEFYYSLSSF